METKNISNKTILDISDPVEQVTDIPRPVVAMAKNFPNGYRIPFHSHDRSQLLYASKGVMTVSTTKGIWVVPPQRAVWIPAGIQHQIQTAGALSMRTLYIALDATVRTPPQCCVVSVPPLLRELILQATRLPRLYDPEGPEGRLFGVILDQIAHLDTTPLALPLPTDPRLRKIGLALAKNPSDNRTLKDWGRTVGATSRTLARLFRSQTQMSFGHWRRQVRILEALKQLGQDRSVTAVAFDLGYDSPSAFISMFKKALGQTPGKYFKLESG